MLKKYLTLSCIEQTLFVSAYFTEQKFSVICNHQIILYLFCDPLFLKKTIL